MKLETGTNMMSWTKHLIRPHFKQIREATVWTFLRSEMIFQDKQTFEDKNTHATHPKPHTQVWTVCKNYTKKINSALILVGQISDVYAGACGNMACAQEMKTAHSSYTAVSLNSWIAWELEVAQPATLINTEKANTLRSPAMLRQLDPFITTRHFLRHDAGGKNGSFKMEAHGTTSQMWLFFLDVGVLMHFLLKQEVRERSISYMLNLNSRVA